MEQLEYNLLFRWFVGLNMDDAVRDATVFTKNRDRLSAGGIAEEFFAAVVSQARGARQGGPSGRVAHPSAAAMAARMAAITRA